MLKRCSLLAFISLLLIGCQHHTAVSSASDKTPKATKTTRHVQVKDFTQVDVQGRINVSLHTGYKKPQLILTGDPRDLAYVKVFINQGTLYVSLGKGYPQFGEVSAVIRGRTLSNFKYVGVGVVKGTKLSSSFFNVYLKNKGTTTLGGYLGLRNLVVDDGGLVKISGISSPHLTIHLKNDPKVQLTGVANLSKLYVDGKGTLSMYWVKSTDLVIRAKQAARIRLAGIANRLDVELWGKSRFDGRYLRAKRSFVKTHGQSLAEISSLKHQSTLATDASDIRYYNLSTTRADFMGLNGAVLDMRDWSNPNIKDFDTYNHQFP